MSQTIRLTITPDLERALEVLRRSMLGTLNSTELIKMAVGGFARMKEIEMTPQELDQISSQQFYQWAKEDGSLAVDNIAHPEKLKPFIPTKHVRAR